MKNKLILLLLAILIAQGCSSVKYQAPEESKEVSHEIWNELLQKHVKPFGKVSYPGFVADSAQLNEYLSRLSARPPAAEADTNYEMAYWINAYNAYTVQLIIRNYPLASIQDLHPTIKIPGVSTVWHKQFFEIGGQSMSLDHIEHGILRKKFDDPRIHFAINCASVSCPKLRAEAYIAERLEEQLEEQTREFINNPGENTITQDEIAISRIFQWFKGDFGSLIDFIDRYTDTDINEEANIRYRKYDWSLNE